MNINESLVLLKFKQTNEIHVYQVDNGEQKLITIPVSSQKHAEGLLALLLELKQLQEMPTVNLKSAPLSNLKYFQFLLGDKLGYQEPEIYTSLTDEYFWLLKEKLLTFNADENKTGLIAAPLLIKKIEFVSDSKIYTVADYKDNSDNKDTLIYKKLKQLNVSIPNV